MHRAPHHPRSPRPGRARISRPAVILGLGAMGVLAGIGVWRWHAPGRPVLPPSTAAAPWLAPTDFRAYAGSASCRDCHEEAYALWAASHHGLAERLPDAGLEDPAFDPPRRFSHGRQTTAVGRQEGRYAVTSVGRSGQAEGHPVVRVIGHDPLRQFLVAAPGGRFQVLEAAYDPRSNDWFNVFGAEDRQPGEWGHWTGRGMNWNHMCAGCHNTRVRKGYDAATDSYRTAMAELSVGCEACHGPLRAHNEWQQRHGKSGRKDPTVPRVARSRVLDTCGSCHARRTDLTGDFPPGADLLDHQVPSLVDRGNLYYPDGQVWDEDYEYSAFLGSKMHGRGVICTDCHSPHSAKTILPGNWLCLRCHNGGDTNAPVIEPVSHSHHRVRGFSTNGVILDLDLTTYDPRTLAETGGECVACHMPTTVYMQRHPRHDHGFTIPDPQLTRDHGIPNACNRCHADKSVDWALEAVERWYGPRMDRPTRHRAQSIARAKTGDPAAREPLRALLAGSESPYWKAVIAGLLESWVDDPLVRTALLGALQHTNGLVRSSAARALGPLAEAGDPPTSDALERLLTDPLRAVRIAAAWSLRATLDLDHPAGRDLLHSLEVNRDQPVGQLQHGAFWFARGQPDRALPFLESAAAWDPNSPPIRHELAVALSALGRPRDAVAHLTIACQLAPQDAEYPYKLALAWHETGHLERATTWLQTAVRLDPRHDRAWYNLGLARSAAGLPEAALDALNRAEALAPRDPRIPFARATVLAPLGRRDEAARAAARVLELDPEHADARRLLEGL